MVDGTVDFNSLRIAVLGLDLVESTIISDSSLQIKAGFKAFLSSKKLFLKVWAASEVSDSSLRSSF